MTQKYSFPDPIMVTRPILPSLDTYSYKLREIWESRWLSNNGSQLQALEQELLEYMGVPNISLFNNGTIALLVAIQSLRLQGEVITTPFSFPATTHVLEWNKITPVFCDILPDSLTIDPSKIERLITGRTTAILGVHVYGVPCQVDSIQEIADRHGLRVVYDSAHAFGTCINGLPIGTFGDISMFSFHPTKLFHTGEGGALTFNDDNLKPRIDLLKNFGIKNEEEVILPGINGKMNEMSAALGRIVLPLVDVEKEKRAELRAVYRERLGSVNGLAMLEMPDCVSNSQQYLAIRVDSDRFGSNRDQIYDKLRNMNVMARKYFFPLISDYPCYSSLPTARADALPVARQISKEILCLPFYGALSKDNVHLICDLILS